MRIILACVLAGCTFGLASIASAAVFTVTVDGPDAIFLAGRTDLTIPAANLPWSGPADHLIRHAGATPEEALESMPPLIAVAAGDVIRVLDPAIGGINFFNGLGPPYFGPSGNGLSGSNLSPLGGISGYIGPQGALAGVFLSDAIPNGAPPLTLNFSLPGSTDFLSISPALGQIFYIGDGVTSGNVLQQFIAPAGATRLFFAIPDGFNFVGEPGAYDDNDGAYQIRVGVNEIPTLAVPEPASLALWGLGTLGCAVAGYRRRKLA